MSEYENILKPEDIANLEKRFIEEEERLRKKPKEEAKQRRQEVKSLAKSTAEQAERERIAEVQKIFADAARHDLERQQPALHALKSEIEKEHEQIKAQLEKRAKKLIEITDKYTEKRKALIKKGEYDVFMKVMLWFQEMTEKSRYTLFGGKKKK